MSETYEQMKARIHPERYTVERFEHGVVKMSRGLAHAAEHWEEPATFATVRATDINRTIVASNVSLNSLSLAIPEGPSGRWPRGINATDEELILAIVGDESVF